MGCQSFCFLGVQHMQLHGLAASVSENVNNCVYCDKGRQFKKYSVISEWNRP